MIYLISDLPYDFNMIYELNVPYIWLRDSNELHNKYFCMWIIHNNISYKNQFEWMFNFITCWLRFLVSRIHWLIEMFCLNEICFDVVYVDFCVHFNMKFPLLWILMYQISMSNCQCLSVSLPINKLKVNQLTLLSMIVMITIIKWNFDAKISISISLVPHCNPLIWLKFHAKPWYFVIEFFFLVVHSFHKSFLIKIFFRFSHFKNYFIVFQPYHL